ncbi:MAG: holo-ACP synthase [Bacilli bacterium]
MDFGIGTDIVKISRIEKALNNQKFINVLTSREKCIYERINGCRKSEWLAGRFAAKEAVFKALSKYTSMNISDIEILESLNGAPSCKIDGFTIEISISHEKEYAIAFAIIIKDNNSKIEQD